MSITCDKLRLATSSWRDFEYQARLGKSGLGSRLLQPFMDREVSQVLFSSDGHSLVTTGDDSTSRLWSLNFTPEGELIGATEVSRLPVSGAASVTADLRYVATDDGGVVCIWWLKQEDLISQVQARLFRNLTAWNGSCILATHPTERHVRICRRDLPSNQSLHELWVNPIRTVAKALPEAASLRSQSRGFEDSSSSAFSAGAGSSFCAGTRSPPGGSWPRYRSSLGL
jgi:WD40 repeat protein